MRKRERAWRVVLMGMTFGTVGAVVAQTGRQNAYDVGGLSGVSRVTRMQNHQVVARNFFAASGVRLQPGTLLAASAGNGGFAHHQDAAPDRSAEPPPSGLAAAPVLLLRRLAAAGSPVARYEIGRRYLTGEGFGKNPETAVRWLRLAAGSGYPQAVRFLRELAIAERRRQTASAVPSGPPGETGPPQALNPVGSNPR